MLSSKRSNCTFQAFGYRLDAKSEEDVMRILREKKTQFQKDEAKRKANKEQNKETEEKAEWNIEKKYKKL